MSADGKLCPVCGKPLGRNKATCSRACSSIYRRNRRECVVCGRQFYCPPSSDKVTCSRECSSQHRQTDLRGTSAANLLKAREAAKTNPETGPLETHHCAKSWVLLSPDGKEHHVRNLELFARQHAGEYGATPKQMGDGIRKIKMSALGNRRRPSRQWKGWRLLAWED